MTIKRTKDPAKLLPDRVTVDLRQGVRPGTPEFDAVRDLLERATPRARIEALRRHAQLTVRADELTVAYERAGNVADDALHASIAEAERAAIYLDAAPRLIAHARQGAPGVPRGSRSPEVDQWIAEDIDRHPTSTAQGRWERAPRWVHDIGRAGFAKRVTVAKKAAGLRR